MRTTRMTPLSRGGESPVLAQTSPDGIATITFNRPGARHAYDRTMVDRMIEVLDEVRDQREVRAVVLRSTGPVFSAGADLAWMRAADRLTESENVAEARLIARMFRTLDELPKPTVALVQGSCYGGGLGFVAACDMAVALRSATFSISEVRFGLIPSIIGPYLVRAITARQARRFVLTGERLSADTAWRTGLIHALVEDERELEAWAEAATASLLAGSPSAIAGAKNLIELAGREPPAELAEETGLRAARGRRTSEAQEGMAAFLERRPPDWVQRRNRCPELPIKRTLRDVEREVP